MPDPITDRIEAAKAALAAREAAKPDPALVAAHEAAIEALNAVKARCPEWPAELPSDRLEAELAIAQAEAEVAPFRAELEAAYAEVADESRPRGHPTGRAEPRAGGTTEIQAEVVLSSGVERVATKGAVSRGTTGR